MQRTFATIVMVLAATSAASGQESLMPTDLIGAWRKADNEKKVAFTSLWLVKNTDAGSLASKMFDRLVTSTVGCIDFESDEIAQGVSPRSPMTTLGAVMKICSFPVTPPPWSGSR